MKRNITLWQLYGYVFVSLFGTFLHFLYDISGKSILVAPFSAVNESIFEHIKLLYFPMLIFAFFESLFFKAYENFWCAKAKGFICAIILIPVLFYTYTGALGVYADWFNISIFFISGAAAFFVDTKSLKKDTDCSFPPYFCKAFILGLGVLFIFFTFFPIEIPLFIDRQSKNYGI